MEDAKAKLFTDARSLPSLACRQRYLDAMLVSRDMKGNASELARRVADADKARLVRERFFLLKSCMMNGDDAKVPYLYHLNA